MKETREQHRAFLLPGNCFKRTAGGESGIIPDALGCYDTQHMHMLVF
jgi:hypothetical protein